MPEARSPSPERSRLLRDFVLIVISVVLGFGVAQFGEHRTNRELESQVLTSIELEMEHNRASLEPLVPVHQVWLDRLTHPDSAANAATGFDVFQALRPTLPPAAKSPFPFLSRSAWDAALSGGGLRGLDYKLVSDLSEVYRVQDVATGNVGRLSEALSSVEIYEPARRAGSVRLLWLTLADIESAEAHLARLYQRDLPAVHDAASSAQKSW